MEPDLGTEIAVGDLAVAGRLQVIGRIEPGTGALRLTLTGDEDTNDRQWVVTGIAPHTALTALVAEAARRDLALQAAYAGSRVATAQLVLTGAEPLIPPTPTLTLVPTDGPSPTPTATATATITPTATWPPDIVMSRIINRVLDPVLEASELFDPEAVFSFAESHPRVGMLNSTEIGVALETSPLPVQEADTLTFYTLQENDPTGRVTRFLYVEFDPSNNATRFPDEQVFFTGKRMSEVMYWVVLRAAERSGQLYVAFDDFGSQQAITVLGFRPFEGDSGVVIPCQM